MKTAPKPQPERCAIYARVSEETQVERYGLDAQLTELRALATQRNYSIAYELVDAGLHGDVLDRPDLTKLRDLVRAKAVDVVLMIDSDRMSRDLIITLLVLDEFKRAGVRLEYPSHAVDTTPEGLFREQVAGAVNQLERAKIRERTARGAREKARQGSIPSGKAPFGYRRDPESLGGVKVEPAEADLVRSIFTWAADGVPLRSIVKRLNTQATIRPHRGGPWAHTSVRSILRSDVYVGQGVYNRLDQSAAKARRRKAVTEGSVRVRAEADWIRYDVTPIVSRALAERARAQIAVRNKHLHARPAKQPYLLAGLLTCGKCGRRMHGITIPRGGIYRCAGALAVDKADRCHFSRTVNDIDAQLWTGLVGVIQDPDTLRSTAKAAKLGLDTRRVDAASEVAELTRELTERKQSRNRLLDLYVAGRLDQADLDAREPALKSEIERLTQAVAEAQVRVTAGQADARHHAALVAKCKLVARGIERLDPGQRQALVRELLTRVTLHPDGRLEIDGALRLGTPTGAPADKSPKTQGREVFSSPTGTDHFSLRMTLNLREIGGQA